MALPPSSEYRGVAAAIAQPASEEDIEILRRHITGLTLYNEQGPRIQYRDPTDDRDIREAVYRWDDRPYDEIFRTGFRARVGDGRTTPDDYYNLERHVNGGGAPGDASPVDAAVFVSTTRSVTWRPLVSTEMILYRYEIFAPGGIDTVLTLGNRHDHPNQQEIAFVGAIDPQYIRSARPYVVIPAEPPSEPPTNETLRGHSYPGYATYGNRIFRNANFNPNPTPAGQTTQAFMNRTRNIVCPRDGETLINLVCGARRQRRDADAITPPSTEEPYNDPGCKVGHYVECAFNFNDREEAFIFTTDQCVLINYAPGTTNDHIIKGPLSIADFFPSLADTIFATGVDAAFTSTVQNEAYLFRSNIYVRLNFASGDTIGRPRKITDGFPCLKDTIFEHGMDAAFASHRPNEAYLFKGDQYARIYFTPGATDDYINTLRKITESFYSLKGTVFAGGIDAAYTAKATNEAYLFRGSEYVLINYAPGTTDDYIIGGPKSVTDNFPSLKGFVTVVGDVTCPEKTTKPPIHDEL